MNKSTVKEIKERFDKDVERFTNLDTGQISAIDARLMLELTTAAAKCIVPNAQEVLDVGCGAGNFTIELLTKLPNLHCTIVDLSQPMLDRAYQRITATSAKSITRAQGDIREVELPENKFDVILAGAVLHHLRDDTDWEVTFSKLYRLLKPNGCLMISDLLAQDSPPLNAYFSELYGDYLERMKGPSYRNDVLDYIKKEDSPRSMTYQIELMQKIGFTKVEILHKHICFGAFCGVK